MLSRTAPPGRDLTGMGTALAGLTGTALLVVTLASCSSASGDTPRPSPTATLPLSGTGEEGDDADPPADGGAADQGGGSLSGRTVVIDPGHNGANAEAVDEINREVDAGPLTKECDTVGAETEDGYTESEFNLDLSLRLRDELEAQGATVVLTRDDNDGVGPCVDERARIGNDANADAAISIHADGGPPTGRGFHVIAPEEIPGYTEDIAEPSARLAEEVRDAYHSWTEVPYADYIGTDGIDVRDDLGGLNLSTVPKVFLEAGNMRHPEDVALLTDEEWRTEAAVAIAEGIGEFLGGE